MNSAQSFAEKIFFENSRQFTSLWFFDQLLTRVNIVYVTYSSKVELEPLRQLKKLFQDNKWTKRAAVLDNEAYRRVCADLQVFSEVGTRQDVYFMDEGSYFNRIEKLADYLELSRAAQNYYLAQWRKYAQTAEEELEIDAVAEGLQAGMINFARVNEHLHAIGQSLHFEITEQDEPLSWLAQVVHVLDYLRYRLIASDDDRFQAMTELEFEVIDGTIGEVSAALSDLLDLAPYSKEKAEFEDLMSLPPVEHRQQLLKKSVYLNFFSATTIQDALTYIKKFFGQIIFWQENLGSHEEQGLAFFTKSKVLEQLNRLPETVEMLNYLQRMLEDGAK